MIPSIRVTLAFLTGAFLTISKLPFVSPCSGSLYQIPPPPPPGIPPSAPSPSYPEEWIRCKTFLSIAECRLTSCLNGEKRLASIQGLPFSSRELCQMTTFYELCYDFNRDTSNPGKCQGDYVGCEGSTQTVLGTVMDDNACKNPMTSNALLGRCSNKLTGKIICRPSKAKCSPGENEDQPGVGYSNEDSCLGAGPALTYYRCVNANNATCRESTTGCLKPEIRSPETVEYKTSDQCAGVGPPIYDLCYDFLAGDTSYYGTCQPKTDTGCEGLTKFKLAVGMQDPLCNANQRNPDLIQYILCQNKAKPEKLNCRPANVLTCNPDGSEVRFPNSNTFYKDLKACRNPVMFDLCYNYTAFPTNSHLGICQKTDVGCSFPNITMLASVEEKTCNNARDKAITYKRCTYIFNGERLCRRSDVPCRDGNEIQDGTSVYNTAADCQFDAYLSYPTADHTIDYPANDNKMWNLVAPTGKQLRFIVIWLDNERQTNTGYTLFNNVCIDPVKIYNGPTVASPVLLEGACGVVNYDTRTTFTTTGSSATVTFTSNGVNQGKGFTLGYDFV